MSKIKKTLLHFIILTFSVGLFSSGYTVNAITDISNENVKNIGYWSESNAPEFYGTTKIVLKKNQIFSLKDTRYRIFAKDFEDFDLTKNIVANHNVNTAVVGNYKIDYSVTDSHGNRTILEVPVIVSDDANVNPMIERTMYTLPSVDNISSIGINRGNNHDRQMLGIFINANSTVKIRKTAGDVNLTYTMLNNDSRKESSRTITSEWSEISFTEDYTPFIKTVYKHEKPVKFEIEWNSSDLGVKELNYYRYGDNEKEFFENWEKDVDSYAVIDGEAVMVLVPYFDSGKIVNYYKKGFKSLDKFLEYYKKVSDFYDETIGLEYNPKNPNHQNVKTQFFVKANANGAGAAYYAGDHVGVNRASVASFFEANWGGLHELGHGYQGSIGKGDLNIGEVTNNIFGHYVQMNPEIYEFTDRWLGDIAKRENEVNEIRINGGTFLDLNLGNKLYFIINFLDSFNGPETYAKIVKQYRDSVLSGKDMSTQDAWVLGISQNYGINLSNYFEEWGIMVSPEVKIKCEEKNDKNAFSLKDLIADSTLKDKIKSDLGLRVDYQLVKNEDLTPYNLKGNLNLNIKIDNVSELEGKYAILKDGTKEVARAKVLDGHATFKDIPVGAYQLQMPQIIGRYENDASYAVVSSGTTKDKEINYNTLDLDSNFENDVKIQFQGYYYKDAAEIKLVNELVSGEEKLKINLRYRGTTLFNSGLAADYEYAKIQILDTNNTEVYKKVVGGKGEMFSAISTEYFDVNVNLGYKVIVKYHNANNKLKFIGNLSGDYRTDYEIAANEEATFIVTEKGLKPAKMNDEQYYTEHSNRFKNYVKEFNEKANENDLYNRNKFINEKGIIARGYKLLNDTDKQAYKELYNILVNGAKPVITVGNKIVETGEYNNIDLATLIQIVDREDGIIDSKEATITTNLDINKAGTYDVSYRVSDSDGNETVETLKVKVTSKADVNSDGIVNIIDLSTIGTKFNLSSNDSGYNIKYDLNNDNIIDIYDLVYVSKRL